MIFICFSIKPLQFAQLANFGRNRTPAELHVHQRNPPQFRFVFSLKNANQNAITLLQVLDSYYWIKIR